MSRHSKLTAHSPIMSASVQTLSIPHCLVLPIQGSPSGNNGVLLADVDSDGADELCVATTDGELLIFRSTFTLPQFIGSGLGSVSALVCGDVYGSGRSSLVAVNADGLCAIFDIPPHVESFTHHPVDAKSWTRYFSDHGREVCVPRTLNATFNFRVPFNVTAAAIGHAGELILSTSDRCVYVYRIHSAWGSSTSHDVSTPHAPVSVSETRSAALPIPAPPGPAAVQSTALSNSPSSMPMRPRNLSPLNPMSQASSMAVAAAAARRRNSPTLNAVPVVTSSTQPVLSSATGPLPALSIDISTPIEYDDSDLDDEDQSQFAESALAFRLSLPVLAQLESIYVWEVNAIWISAVHVASAIDFKTLGTVSSVDRFAVLFACTDAGFSVLYSDGTTSAISDNSAQSPNSTPSVSISSSLLTDFALQPDGPHNSNIVHLNAQGRLQIINSSNFEPMWVADLTFKEIDPSSGSSSAQWQPNVVLNKVGASTDHELATLSPMSAPTAFTSLHRIPHDSGDDALSDSQSLVMVAWNGLTFISHPHSPTWFRFRPDSFGTQSITSVAAASTDTNDSSTNASARRLDTRLGGNTSIVASCAGRLSGRPCIVYVTNLDHLLVYFVDDGMLKAHSTHSDQDTQHSLSSFVSSLPAEVQSRHDKNLQRMTPQQVHALLSVDIPLLQMYRNWLRDDISRLERAQEPISS